MHTPQEIQVWYILPSIRKKYALLLKNKGLKQKEIAKIMGVTEAAISQYIKNKRANLDFPKEIDTFIKKSITDILNQKTNFRIELQRALKKINKKKIICSVCKAHTERKEECNICFED